MPLKRDASDLSHVALVSLLSSSSLHRSRFVRCPVSVKLLEPHYIVYDSDTLDSNFTLQTNSSTGPQTNTPFPFPVFHAVMVTTVARFARFDPPPLNVVLFPGSNASCTPLPLLFQWVGSIVLDFARFSHVLLSFSFYLLFIICPRAKEFTE